MMNSQIAAVIAIVNYCNGNPEGTVKNTEAPTGGLSRGLGAKVTLKCQKGYKPKGGAVSVECKSHMPEVGQWVPTGQCEGLHHF